MKMNRPKLQDYKFVQPHTFTSDISGNYVNDLEQYCNELEKEKFELLNYKAKAHEQIEKYVKAFDNACDFLELKDKTLYSFHINDGMMSKKEWKEWLLKDE